MAGTRVVQAGGSGPHNNMMPYLILNDCIALQGAFLRVPEAIPAGVWLHHAAFIAVGSR